MTLGELVGKKESFQYLISQREKLNGKVNYQLSKNIKPFDEELKAYEEARENLARKYANKDEKGNPVVIGGNYDIPYEVKAAFDKEIRDLQDTEIELSVKPIKIEDIENAGLSAIDYYNLKFMLEE